MDILIVESEVVAVSRGKEKRPIDRRNAGSPRASVRVALAPALVTAVSLATHLFLPNGQTSAPVGLYTRLLEWMFGASLVLAIGQWLWSPLRRWGQYYGPLLAGGAGLLGAWDLITLKFDWLPLPFFPGPDMVIEGILEDWAILLDSALLSLRLLLSGFVIGVALGLVTGVLMGWFFSFRYWATPGLKILGPIPATALVPLAMVLFSNSFHSGVAIIAFAVWFPVTVLTNSGIANVPVAYLDVARTLGAGRWYLIFRVAIPAALPFIFIGVFIGLLVSFLSLIVAETVGVKNGLGWYLKWQQGNVVYAKVWGVIAIMAVFYSTLLTLLFKARDQILGWQKGMIRW